MTFVCPTCRGRHLSISFTIELRPTGLESERQLQLLACPDCGHLAGGVYEESRAGALDGDAGSHDGYDVEAAAWSALRDQIRACPEPRSSHCPCPLHERLSRAGPDGIWRPPAGFTRRGRLDLAPPGPAG